jgi:transcriptional regulator with XRE-family HTH domain
MATNVGLRVIHAGEQLKGRKRLPHCLRSVWRGEGVVPPRKVPKQRGSAIGVVLAVGRLDGEALASARVAAGLTQPGLALALGVSGGTRVWLWERGAEQPRPKFIPALAKILGVKPLRLLEGDPERPTISALRLAAGLTRDEVWERARITKMTYHRIDRGVGVRAPDPSVVRAVAAVLGISEGETLAAIERARGPRHVRA